MWRYLVGGVAALLMAAAGIVLYNGVARPPLALALQPPAPQASAAPAPLPDAAPEATEKTREQKRFDRYDKDRNGSITRDEYLAARRKAFARLDVNHDGTLSFDEWAVKSEAKFAAADADKSGAMTPAEFVKTAVKRSYRSRAACPPSAATPAPAEPARDDGEDDN